MRSKRDIIKGPGSFEREGGGGGGGGVTFGFLNRDAISNQNMPLFIRSRGSLKDHTRF